MFKKNKLVPKSDVAVKVLMYAFLSVLAFLCIVPFLYVIGSSFQTQSDITANGYKIIPTEPTLDTYKMILESPKRLIDAYAVTIGITVVGTIGGLWIMSTYAYVISRKSYRYRKILSLLIFFTMLFSGGLIPSYILMTRWLGLKDSYLALILPLLCSAWNILLMKGFFQSIPESLIEAAKIDGASELGIFARIVVPISKPAFATIGLFLLLGYWNSWYQSLLYIETPSKVTLQYMLMTIMNNIELLNSAEAQQYGMALQGYEAPTLGARMAMCVLAVGPIVFVFLFFQKYFVSGLTVGSVKG